MLYYWIPFLILLLTACQPQGSGGMVPQLVQPGILQGHVSIGPLTPVQREGVPTPTVSADVYAAQQIMVYQPDGKTVVTRITPDAKGDYSVTLAPGQYVVNVAKQGIQRARDLPATVTIESGMTARLDISIDTGIR